MAATEERRECRQMGLAQKRLDHEISQLDKLHEFRCEYQHKNIPTGHVSSARWQNYQKFLQRLDQAVTAQKQQVLTGKQNRDAHRKRWMAKRQRLESLERIVERYRASEKADAERQLQKALDDLPGREDFYRQE